MSNSKVKLLAPAGSYESLQAAIQAGADEVYFGIEGLNMRAGAAVNFKLEDLPEIRKICKNNKVKSYVAINTVLYEQDLNLVRKIIDSVKINQIDGIFAADIAAIEYARSIGVEVHISTQLSVSNYETVKYWSKYADRIVLARELNLKQIEFICDQIKKEKLKGPKRKLIEIEIFAHGALCISISGRCGMSLYHYNASANRGVCKQPCRKAYKVTDIESGKEQVIDNEFVMSPKDICTISFMDQILNAGVNVIKIEGRGRQADYVERVTRCYREAIDSVKNGTYTKPRINNWMEKLGTVFNRGMSDGYYLGKSMGEWSASYGSKATQEKHYVGRVQKYYPRKKIAEIKTEALEISKGEEFVIQGKNTGVVRGTFSELRTDEEGFITNVPRKRIVTFPLSTRVRKNDQLYVLRKRGKEQVALPYR